MAVLFALLQGIEEGSDPVTMITDLNHVYRSMLPILNRHAGILDSPGGVGMRAYFGILPRIAPLAVSSLQAVHAGMALLDFIRELNESRVAAGQVPLDLSVGVCTGMVVAGGVEALGQIRLTALGAAADQAQIIARAAGAKPGSTLLISMDAHRALHSARDHFSFGRQGELPLGGDGHKLGVIEVLSRSTKLIDPGDLEPLISGSRGRLEG